MNEIQPGQYRHYKGNVYQVTGIGKHTETEEEMVVYQPIGGGQIWLRPVSMFLEQVEHEGRTVPRFEYLGKTQGNFYREPPIKF